MDTTSIMDYMTGGLSLNLIIAMSLWAYIGMIINLVSDLLRRKSKSLTSPQKLSFTYWWMDNWKRLLLSIILVPVVVIIFKEAMGVEISIMGAIGIGFGADHLIEIVKRKAL